IDVVLPHYILQDRTFGQLCADLAEDDFSRNRFHEYGKTILEQLRFLKAGRIAAARKEISGTDKSGRKIFDTGSPIRFPNLSTGNVVTSYLLYHLSALHLAERAAQSERQFQQKLSEALIMETIAQGFLADAFSSGHLLVPVSDRLAPLHGRNTRETHNFYRNQGVYVINSRGEVWQTFGDRLMHWYAPAYRAVLEACRHSLRELLIVFYHSKGREIPPKLNSWLNAVAPNKSPASVVSLWLSVRDGVDYYAERWLPTLMLLPMPVTASWSYRTQERDSHNIRKRRHFPQLREEGFHDPDLINIDRSFLYPRDKVPDWLIPQIFLNEKPVTPDSLIRTHPDWASVQWIQNRHVPPSFKGMLLGFGGQMTIADGENNTGGMLAVGYGLWNDLLLVRNVSVGITLYPSLHQPERLMLAQTAGFDFPFSITSWLGAFRAEGGTAIGLRRKYDDIGGMFAIGLNSRVFSLRFTNAGFTWRLKYQCFYLERTIKGLALEVIFQ
ncbi:MAG: hypothetical protein JSV44_03505, partial [Candidatus Zixiibacteriota bacterium]